MGQTRVAGTIMLSEKNGHKKFLVKHTNEGYGFIATRLEDGKTGLASILDALKEHVQIDVTNISLVDLSNVVVDGEKIPLFVFEMAENETNCSELDSHFSWENPATLRAILEKLDLSGVPLFNY